MECEWGFLGKPDFEWNVNGVLKDFIPFTFRSIHEWRAALVNLLLKSINYVNNIVE